MQSGTKKLLSLLGTFVLVWLTVRFLLPLFSPFLLGALLALACEPMVGFLQKRLGLPRGLSAGLGVSMAFCLLFLLILLLCAFAVRQLRLLAGILPDLTLTVQESLALLRTWLLSLSARTPPAMESLLSGNVNALFANGTALLQQALRFLLGLAGNLLSHVPDSALGLGTAVISGFMISAKLPKIRRWIRARIPKERIQSLLAALRRIRRCVGRWLLAQIKMMGLTFAVLLAGFFLLRVPHAPVWAAGVALVDAFPILGTGTVLLPWSAICLLQGNTPRALGLLGLYAAVSLLRSAAEPKLLGRHLGLDPLVTLIALYAGYQLWGIGGMVFAPLLTVIAFQILPQGRKPDRP